MLIVEDEQDSRELLGEMLGLYGAECWTAEDVPSARAKLSEVTPDLILTDIGMPGEDGYSLLRWVRGRPPPPLPPPVIAVTAYDLPNWHAVGFEAHIQKPIDLARLLRTIVAAMAKRESQP